MDKYLAHFRYKLYHFMAQAQAPLLVATLARLNLRVGRANLGKPDNSGEGKGGS